jgi:hypothetical protein
MSKKIKKKKTNNVDDVRVACQQIGDSLHDKYDDTQDLKSAQGAVSAYAAAISAMKAQLIYKKMTSTPGRIAFFETE